jgi:hypothetical protein
MSGSREMQALGAADAEDFDGNFPDNSLLFYNLGL